MKVRLQVIVALACATFASLLAPTVLANGRFPGARQVVISPTTEDTLLLRTTFGQMLTRDGGKSFRWICEEAIGYGGTQDPAVGITQAGTLLNAAYEGTSVSLDAGCSFPFPPGLEKRYSTDLTVDASAPAHALVIVAANEIVQPPLLAELWETRDDGQSFARLSALPAGFFPQNVDIARSSPQRVYVTGLQTGGGRSQPSLLRSDDGGASWEQREVPVFDANVYLSAVDPFDAARIYVRVERDPDDELLLSTDAGETYSSLIEINGGMLGFALSPDGSRIAVGGPSGGVLVAARDDGLFVPASATPVTCLAWSARALYACGVDEIASGFALGASSDEGKTFAPLLPALGDVCGPITSSVCGPTTPYAQACPGRWPGVLATLRSTTGAPAACTAAVGGASGAAGAGAVGGSNAGSAGGPGGPSPSPTPDDGCAARQGATSRVGASVLGVLALAGFVGRHRRLRRGGRSSRRDQTGE